MRRSAGIAAAVVLALAAPALAQRPPSAELRLDGEPHAGFPFGLVVVVEGLDESPTPVLPPVTVAGATVTPERAEPNTTQSIQIINGRRFDERVTTWMLHYRVEAAKAGDYKLPAITINQNGTKVVTEPAVLQVRDLATTEDMKLQVNLPDRPVWVGETIEGSIEWLLRRDVDDQTLAVPLLSMEDDVTVTAPPVKNRRQAIGFSAGARTLEIEFTRDEVSLNGRNYTRLRFPIFLTPRRAGAIEIPAASVVAGIAVGRPDFFGRAESRKFVARDRARTLEVRALPQSGKPGGFAGAVGTSFSIAARSSRSVVQLGEPVDLEITIKSSARLDTLSLGRLDGEGGLPAKTFTVPADPPVGELADDGKTKTFRASVQVVGPASEIPALALSYFDPIKGQYQTIHSEPIALSVKGGAVVSAADVVGAPVRKSAPASMGEEISFVGANLALSAVGEASADPLGGNVLWIVLGCLYAVPLLVFGIRSWQVRTASSRGEASDVRNARRQVEAAVSKAESVPAKEAAVAITGALRHLARVLGRSANDPLLGQIETVGFAPGNAPLDEALRRDASSLAKRWLDEHGRRGVGKASAALLLLAALTAAPPAEADVVADGRTAYQEAMGRSDAGQRRAAFARAAASFASAVAAHPDNPDLLTDWGNASLGAGDLGHATLAYRRALAIEGDHHRARTNLAWVRARQPDHLRRASGGATEALFFFHTWPRSRRFLVGAIAFAAAVLLAAPWSPRRRKLAVGVAIPLLVVWGALTISLVVEDRARRDAVVLAGTVLRAADAASAPAALAAPLPAGAEVVVLERRGGWSRIELASGATGWVSDGSIALVATR